MKPAILVLLVLIASLATALPSDQKRGKQNQEEMSDLEKYLVETVKLLLQSPEVNRIIMNDPELNDLASEIMDSRDGRILLFGKKAVLALKLLTTVTAANAFLNLFTTTTTTTTVATTAAGRRR